MHDFCKIKSVCESKILLNSFTKWGTCNATGILGSCDHPGWKLRDHHKKVQSKSKGLLSLCTGNQHQERKGLGGSLREVGAGFLRELVRVKAVCRHVKAVSWRLRSAAACLVSMLNLHPWTRFKLGNGHLRDTLEPYCSCVAKW